MITGNRLINVFRNQNRNTIWKYLDLLAKAPNVFSDHLTGIGPHLQNNNFYIYAAYKYGDNKSLVIVCLDNCPPKEELADEEPFNEELPKYFTENSHRTSPVWLLSETIKLIRKKMEEGNNHWPILGVLLTESTFINAEDMQDIWDEMNITVIDKLRGLAHKDISVNRNDELSFGTMIMDFIQKLNETPEQIFAKREQEFTEMLNKFINETPDKKNEDEEDEEDESDYPDEEEENSSENDIFDFGLPSGVIEQNQNITVQAKILPPLANPKAELDKLVGCKEIKKRIDELMALTRYNTMVYRAFPDAKLHKVSLHSIFFGRPGTGKTTVCKIFGSLLREAGALSKGHVVVANRGTFIGTLWGDEERSVRQVLEMAQGGVLMIDEAYLLHSKNERDPGHMVIQLLMEVLADETQRNIAIVLCGYKEPMMRLLDSNPGLHSRFPNRFEFNDFTVDELLEITRHRISEYKYHFTRQAWLKYKNILMSSYQVRDPQSWGNARFIANQLERIFIQHAQRCVKEKTINAQRLLTITSADISPIEVPRPKPRIGF